MSRRLIAVALLVPSLALADEEIAEQADDKPDEIPDQSVGGQLGIAGGSGGVTPGGFRVSGHYLYRLSEQDWFDGAASFTFGSGGAECFRDRMDDVVCDHGFAEGRGVEVIAAVRRYFGAQGQFVPYAKLGVGISIVRFSDDDVTGVALPIHAGGGVRANVSEQVAITASGELIAGLGRFNRGIGTEAQFGIAILAGAEFRLP